MSTNGKFVISLDFELLWGVREKKTIEEYGKRIISARKVFPRLLDLFEAYKIKGTFATLGFLFASNKEELFDYFPKKKPNYSSKSLSPYNGYLQKVKDSEEEDKYHYASDLLKLLKKYPNQEIATHTFSHYYCLEKGQTIDEFSADLDSAKKIAQKFDVEFKSIVFPRNQFNKNYIKALEEAGITAYRGNEDAWFYEAVVGEHENWYRRMLRKLDSYINISGHNCYSIDYIKKNKPYNIPSSRFLRPYTPQLRSLEPFRIKRILNGMTYAAKHNKVFHLWWHPHNFGGYIEENFKTLTTILDHYSLLNAEYGFESITMKKLSEEIEEMIN